MFNRFIKYYKTGKTVHFDASFTSTKELNEVEIKKMPIRSDVINFILQKIEKKETNYLEIGVRNPEHNFNKIVASNKYSVDPGIEFKENPVDFKMTSDEFFSALRNNELLDAEILFDVIFIDGLHLAEQVERDIENSLAFLHPNGFIVLHDCNPPSEWHARETYSFQNSPAMNNWNGTTWKAFYKARQKRDLYSCCIDSDWGIGILSKSKNIGKYVLDQNPYFEFSILNNNRKEHLNLISFLDFQSFF